VAGGTMLDMNAEQERLHRGWRDWKRWGPYLSERAWGTVREDYSEDGNAWEFFPHDHARSRVYRWNEDGLAGISDEPQVLCFALALWNGRDPILKERIFGLTGDQGNHGEDAKEYWWYLDSTPTHSFMKWRYLYPQRPFPYAELVEVNRRRGRHDPEYELIDTGVFDEDRYWDVTAEYAKAGPDDICVRIRVRNAGPDEEAIHVLPTLWFRNTWSWGLDDRRPRLVARDGRVETEGYRFGRMSLVGDGRPDALFCENESNAQRLWGVPGSTRYPKDGIHDHVVQGLATVNPEQIGTKASLHYRVSVPPGQIVEVRLRLSMGDLDLQEGWEKTVALRQREADQFFAELTPLGATEEVALVLRRALSGMLWSKQLYHYDVDRWLEGDPADPPPPERRMSGRNSSWRHLNNHDVISMPDKWEYPWYAAWDLAFHCVPLAHVDPGFAKHQLLLLLREWYMHPNGQLPAYEWSFGDVNPPVHAWAALKVFEIDGSKDFQFLERIMHKLLLNFTWWVNRKDSEGNNVFEGGFLGLDNIGPIDRSGQLPLAGHLEQSDGTAWMAMYCLNLWEMSLILAEHDETYQDLAIKFFEHFAYIASAMYEQGLWNEEDGFYYDVLHLSGEADIPLRVRSMVGLIPLYATTTLGRVTMERLSEFTMRFQWFLKNKPRFAEVVGHANVVGQDEGRLFSIVDPERLGRILSMMLAEDEFLSPYGLRALSKWHREHPLEVEIGGMGARVDYEPGESTTGLFGGNSNWRGPVWFPVNYLVIESLRVFHRYLGDEFTAEMPTGSGREATLDEIATELSWRLVGLFLDDRDGRRPVFGSTEKFQRDPSLHDMLPFHEYFHGDTGAGLGASHQTGWTGLVADLILRHCGLTGKDG
jgi:hypothetical protein